MTYKEKEAARILDEYDREYVLTLFDIAAGKMPAFVGLNRLFDLHIAFMDKMKSLNKQPTTSNDN